MVKFFCSIFLIVSLVSCKENEHSKEKRIIEKKIVQNTYIGNDLKNDNCFFHKDSVKVKRFVSGLIKDINNYDYESIINKLENPQKERDMIKEMSKEYPEYFQAIFTKEIYDEDDNLKGNLKGSENIEFVYKLTMDNCFKISVGLDTGLYFTIKKDGNRILISEYTMAD